MASARVALSKDFLKAMAQLPLGIQKKTREFMEKFQQDPTQSGLNFERLEGVRDPKVRSVRVDQKYRVILVHPPKGDVYLCVWVDNHDEAYDWARNRTFEVHPRSGAFQIYDQQEVAEIEREVEERQKEFEYADERALFESHDDEELMLAGVPELLLPSVRELKNEKDLDRLAPHLPEEAGEMLYYLAAGYSLTDAFAESERSRAAAEAIDPEDFAAALDLPESRRSYKILDDDRELAEMLDAPLDQWRFFLHPTQRKLVERSTNGPVRVLGSAGTGKTVVLMHRVKHLLQTVFTDPNDRVFVTTYARNLAKILEADLRELCGKSARRLEVMTLHSWAVRFLRQRGMRFDVIDQAQRDRAFQQAVDSFDGLDQPASFYQDEWDQVVQAQEVVTRDDYFAARRVGRGVRLTRKDRARAWEVLGAYRDYLNENSLVEWPDVIREARALLEKEGGPAPYRAVLADEVQDFEPSGLRLLRAMSGEGPNDMFLVGDGHQRIYGSPVVMSHCGIHIRGRSVRLKLNYRTTLEIHREALRVIEGRRFDDLDGGEDTTLGYHSLRSGPEPTFRLFDQEQDEVRFLLGLLDQWGKEVPLAEICVACRSTNAIKTRYLPPLETAQIPHVVVERDPQAEAEKPGVRIATMHRMKGLEFRRVIVVGVQKGQVPYGIDRSKVGDANTARELETRERSLFYVTLSRARDELVVTGFGERSPFVKD